MRQLLRNALATFALVSGLAGFASAYTIVQVSSTSPAGLEASFIAATTSQFTASVVTNPFFANTTQVMLYGDNPRYAKPVSNQDLLNAIVTVDSYTYVYGWADGADYQQTSQISDISQFAVNCSSQTYFLKADKTKAWDPETCRGVLVSLLYYLYQESLTPAPVRGF